MMTESNGTEAGEAVLSPPIIRSLEQQLSLVFWDVQSECLFMFLRRGQSLTRPSVPDALPGQRHQVFFG